MSFPEPVVGALIFNPEGKLLLIKSHKWRGKYTIPGGHIELGEKIEDALRREIKEETGLDVYDLCFVGFQEFIFGEEFYKKKHFIFLDFTCKTDTSEASLNSEAEDFIWADLKEISQLDVEPCTLNLIKEYLSKLK